MKSKIKIALLLTASLYLVSCSDNFLDTEPTGVLSSDAMNEIAAGDPASVLEPLISGLYATTFAWQTGGTTGQHDFGQKHIDICTDMMCCDMAGRAFTYNYYQTIAQYTGQIRTNTYAYMPWRFYYRMVKAANEVLDILGGDEQMPDDEAARAYYGQAKAMRAYCYYYLVNLYQHPYSDKKDSPGVPVYRTQLDGEMHGQSTVGAVYELIIKDLEDAVVALENFDRPDKSRINKDVANGLLANAYLFTGEYQKAAAAAEAVIATGSYPILQQSNLTTTGFNSVENSPNWMWGISITPDNYTGISCWWSMVDIFTYGYPSAGDIRAVDTLLYASMPEGDARKAWFTTDPTFYLAPTEKFYDNGRVVDGDMAWVNDYLYMRVEEMYLIKAEALAQADDLPGAAAALKNLLDERNPSRAAALASMDKLTLLDEIYYNWRVEMWGEGKAYYAMKRFKRTAKRGGNHSLLAGKEFPYNYERMIFEIPENEWNNNSSLVPQN